MKFKWILKSLAIMMSLVLMEVISQPIMKPTSKRVQQLVKKLKKLDNRIQFLQNIQQVPSYNNHLLSVTNNTVSYNQQTQIFQRLPHFSLRHLKSFSDQILTVNYQCRILGLNSSTSKYYFVKLNSDSTQLFVLVNHHTQTKMYIYNHQCQLLHSIQDFMVDFVFEDKTNLDKNSQNKLIYVITHKNQLAVIDFSHLNSKQSKKQQISAKNRIKKSNQQALASTSSINRIYRILNNKVVENSIQGDKIVGVLIKAISSQKSSKDRKQSQMSSSKSKQKQLFIIFSSSLIKVFDQQGSHKITIKQSSLIQDQTKITSLQQKSSIHSVVDHHPFALLVEDNWIYLLDMTKYAKHVWTCPFMPKIKKVFVQTYHANQLYVLTQQWIFLVNLKSNKDNKKACQITKQISYSLKSIRSIHDISFTVSKNVIFLNDIAYNLTSNQYFTLKSFDLMHQSLQTDAQGQQQRCLSVKGQYIQLNYRNKKSLQKNSYFAYQCQVNKDTYTSFYLILFSLHYQKPQSSIVIWILLALIFIIFMGYKLFKSNPNQYQRQILQSSDLQAIDKKFYKDNQTQIKEYLNQAIQIEKRQSNHQSQQPNNYQSKQPNNHENKQLNNHQNKQSNNNQPKQCADDENRQPTNNQHKKPANHQNKPQYSQQYIKNNTKSIKVKTKGKIE